MTAIYKRELKSYFHSMIGCIFIAFLLAFTGVYFTAYNLQAGYPYFAYTLSGALIIYIVGIPLITMKSFSEERKNKTDQMLLTAPVSLTKVVLGKYLSMVTVLAIPSLISCIFPLIIKLNGNAYLKVDYLSILTFFLLGCVFIAVGMFISALTESQIIAYIGAFGIFLLVYLWNGVTGFFPTSAVGNYLTNVLSKLALADVFSQIFKANIVDISGIVLYLSIIAVFIFLTIQAIQKKRTTYNAGLTAIVLAIVIVANLVVGELPEQYRNIDVSSTDLYEITETSTDFLAELDKDVTFTIFAVEDKTDERIKTFISKYTSYTDKISVEWIDPVLHPTTVSDYGAAADSIHVSCEETGKSTVVNFSDIIVYDEYSYYYYGSHVEKEFDAEGQLTSAVNYVTNTASQNIYMTSDHGEATLAATASDLMDKNLYNVNEISLMMDTTVPEDCDLLIMYAPATDITEDELTAIQDYMAAGGNFLLLIGDKNVTEFENLSALMEEYGIEPVDGYIADTERCYQGNPYYIFPELYVSDDLANGLASEMVLMTYAHGVNMAEPARDTITLNEFMSTSSNSYAVTDTAETQGTYTIGVTATEELDEGSSNFTVISGATIIDSQIIDTFTSLDNTTMFMNVVTSNIDGVENLSIEAKSLEIEYNTVQYVGLLSLLAIFGIPLVILIAGFVIWFRRRKA